MRLRFAIRIANRKSLAIWNQGLGAAILLRFEKGSKSQIARFDLRFEAFLTAIWGIFLRFGLRDLKSLAIRDLWFGALSITSFFRINYVWFGILPGWYGMENGQKPEMEKKWKSKWKTAPSWTGAKTAKKWPKNGQIMEFSIIFQFLGHFFLPFCPCPARCRFPFRFPFFFHFRLLAVFHAIPARQDPNVWCKATVYIKKGMWITSLAM